MPATTTLPSRPLQASARVASRRCALSRLLTFGERRGPAAKPLERNQQGECAFCEPLLTFERCCATSLRSHPTRTFADPRLPAATKHSLACQRSRWPWPYLGRFWSGCACAAKKREGSSLKEFKQNNSLSQQRGSTQVRTGACEPTPA